MKTFSKSTTEQLNPLAQIRMACDKPGAAALGATAGLVPVGVFVLGHYEITSWNPLECPKAALVYAGLIFSILTVLGWSVDMFGSRLKALGFTALLEGIMMTADAHWLTVIALIYLVAINAVANGCRLALRDQATEVDWRSNLGRCLAAAGAAAAGAAQGKKRARRAPRRRAVKPHLAVAAA